MADKGSIKARTPALEWIAAGIGLVLTLTVLVVLGREALGGDRDAVPALVVTVKRVVARDGQYLVEVKAANRTGAAASHVEIEGVLAGEGGAPVTGRATIDYVPGNSSRKAGLLFDRDPRGGTLQVRALGYEEP